MGLEKYQRAKTKAEVMLGISIDEIQRMKDSSVKWITHKFPLIDEMNWSRQDCLDYFTKIEMPLPPRSACWMCPYKSDDEWIYLRDKHPAEFAKAVEFDTKIRNLPQWGKVQNPLYLHRTLKPLGEVDFRGKNREEEITMENECDGMCGL